MLYDINKTMEEIHDNDKKTISDHQDDQILSNNEDEQVLSNYEDQEIQTVPGVQSDNGNSFDLLLI